jgi:hypothetical protein
MKQAIIANQMFVGSYPRVEHLKGASLVSLLKLNNTFNKPCFEAYYFLGKNVKMLLY